MATVLDFSILSSLSIIFIFIATFIASWGVTLAIDPFKLKDQGKKIYAILAFALSFIVILYKPVLSIIAFSIPWFAIVLMIGFFMIFFIQMFSTDLDLKYLVKHPSVWGFLIFFVVVIFLFALSNSIGQELLEQQVGPTDADLIQGNFGATDEFIPVEEYDNGGGPGAVNSASVSAQPGNTGTVGNNIVLTLFHPKILGMLFMMLLGTITMLMIAK